MLPDDMQIPVGVAYVDSRGNPAQVDGNVTWSSSDDTIITVTASTTVPQQKQAVIQPAGAGNLAQAQVTATADADLGAGMTTLLTTFDVQVLAGQAVAGTISPIGSSVPIGP